jgi:hypothetical protein
MSRKDTRIECGRALLTGERLAVSGIYTAAHRFRLFGPRFLGSHTAEEGDTLVFREYEKA